jgi:acetyl-CoA C-acetyltransferase
MKEAVIVSAARTPIGKAYRGAFNNLESPSMTSFAVKAAVERSGIDPKEVDDCIMGAALQQGTQGFNLGRQVAMASGLPVSVAGMTIDRQCSSGLMSIATGAKHIINDNAPITVAGGCESVSLVQNEHMNSHRVGDPLTIKNAPTIHMPMPILPKQLRKDTIFPERLKTSTPSLHKTAQQMHKLLVILMMRLYR